MDICFDLGSNWYGARQLVGDPLRDFVDYHPVECGSMHLTMRRFARPSIGQMRLSQVTHRYSRLMLHIVTGFAWGLSSPVINLPTHSAHLSTNEHRVSINRPDS